MYKKDYILRMIEEASKFLAYVLGLISKEQLFEAIKEIQDAYSTYFNIETSFIDELKTEDQIIAFAKKQDLMQLELLAKFLKAEGDCHYKQNNIETSKVLYNKSLIFFKYIQDTDTTSYSFSRINMIQSVSKRIEELENE